MKKNILAICVLISAVLISCNNNEPEQQSSKKGEITFSIPAPALNNGNNSPVRTIYGELKETNIIFKWNSGDIINFEFFDSSKAFLYKKSHTVLASEISEGALTVTINAPEGTKYVSAVSGPDAILNKQYAVVGGISNNHMRFESDTMAVVDGTNTLNLFPIWSAIILTPKYEFIFDGMNQQETGHTTSYVGMDDISITQTIGSKSLPITLIGTKLDGSDGPIKRSANEGAAPVASYIVVLSPADECDLSIVINYNATYFYGFSDATWDAEQPHFTTGLNGTTISPLSMSTTGQSVKNIVKGQAYDITALKSHPVTVHWKKN